MIPAAAHLLSPLLRRLDPERAHRLAVLSLRLGLAGRASPSAHPALATTAMGLVFANPIGLAAGFDKDATAVRGLSRLGFGFIETGTVTPRPQPGNPTPRVFRLAEDQAVINRYGFNGQGLDAYVDRLERWRRRPTPRGARVPLGANVGLNKNGSDPERDYAALVAAVAPVADYVVINVSSPNTPGLRDLQGEARLRTILQAVATLVPRRPPLLVKLAPDLGEAALEAIVEAAVTHGVQGLIIGNTTLSRPAALRSPLAGEAGGLSGPPLRALSTAVLARAHRLAAGRLTLVGCGGIGTGADVLARIRAGAHLVQLYTALIYQGPALIGRLQTELLEAMREQGFRSVSEAVGTALMRHLPGISAIAAEYDGFVLDLWGVVHDGVNPYPGAPECLQALRAAGKRVVMLTNAPRRAEPIRKQLRRMGIDDALYDGVMSSGEASHALLRDRPDDWARALGRRVFHMGPEKDKNVLTGLDLDVLDAPGGATCVLNTGPDDDLDPTDPAAYDAVMQDAARMRLPMICANPDLEVLRGGARVLCAGTFAARYQAMGGDVRSLGKPDPLIYAPVLEMLAVPRARVLAVGDALRTDMAGARASGLDGCWVLGGLHGEHLGEDRAKIEKEAAAAGLAPVATVPRFNW